MRGPLTRFGLDDTFWLDLVFGALALHLFWFSEKHPIDHGRHHEHGHHRPEPEPAQA